MDDEAIDILSEIGYHGIPAREKLGARNDIVRYSYSIYCKYKTFLYLDWDFGDIDFFQWQNVT